MRISEYFSQTYSAKSILTTFIMSMTMNFHVSGQNFHNYKVSYFTKETGLSQNSALTLGSDPNGFIWVGTEAGLNKFNGYEFTIFQSNLRKENSISDNHITSIDFDPL